MLADSRDLEFAGSVSRVADALEVLQRVRPDIVLIDGSSGLTPALRLLGNLRTVSPNTRAVLWVVDLPEMDAFRALHGKPGDQDSADGAGTFSLTMPSIQPVPAQRGCGLKPE